MSCSVGENEILERASDCDISCANGDVLPKRESLPLMHPLLWRWQVKHSKEWHLSRAKKCMHLFYALYSWRPIHPICALHQDDDCSNDEVCNRFFDKLKEIISTHIVLISQRYASDQYGPQKSEGPPQFEDGVAAIMLLLIVHFFSRVYTWVSLSIHEAPHKFNIDLIQHECDVCFHEVDALGIKSDETWSGCKA